jgi:hypothetical protein
MMPNKCNSCGSKTDNPKYCSSCVNRYNLSNEDAKAEEVQQIINDLELLNKVKPENYDKVLMMQNQTIINLLSVIAQADNPLITTPFIQAYKQRLEEEINKL